MTQVVSQIRKPLASFSEAVSGPHLASKVWKPEPSSPHTANSNYRNMGQICYDSHHCYYVICLSLLMVWLPDVRKADRHRTWK